MATVGKGAGTRRKATAFTRLMKKKAGAKLKKSREVLRYMAKINDLKDEINLLTAYSSDTIYRLRYDTMRYDYISPSVQRLLGYSQEEMKEMNFRSLIIDTKIVTDGLRSVDSYEKLEDSRRSGDVAKWQADYLIQTKDGRELWISDISYPWFDKKGNLIGSLGCLRDISDRVEAEVYARQELVRLANTDQLTGLANRRVFFEKLEDEIRRGKRAQREFSMLLIDVDHFKRINDTYGHDIGDTVLREIGQIINSCLRDTDVIARLGGEEFGVFLPDTPLSGAYYVAERIRSAVAKQRFFAGEGKGLFTSTVSIGVADSSAEEQVSANRLYKVADTRLYIAKNTGRNQVSIDEIVQLH